MTVNSPWTKDDDLVLVDIILRHIREGRMMKEAFEQGERALHRTAASCKFRWASNLSKVYDASVELAKLQRSIHMAEKEGKGEEEIMSGIVLPKNRPINTMSEAFQKSKDKQKRVGTMTIETQEDIQEVPVTTGIQQEIDFKTNSVQDAKEEKAPDNPFLMIRKFVKKMEREHGDIYQENTQLKNDVSFLQSQLDEARRELAQAKQDLYAQGVTLDEARKQLEQYAEIKQLIKQFNREG